MDRHDNDGMRGMKSYLSIAEAAVLAHLNTTSEQLACPEIQDALPDSLTPKYRQGINKMMKSLIARGYVRRYEHPRNAEAPWVRYRITPEGRKVIRRIMTDFRALGEG